MSWIVVRNWEKFQHRDAARAVVPTWIKLHTRLLSDPAYLGLAPETRSLLLEIWLEYAIQRRNVPLSTATLSRRFDRRVLTRQLEALNRAGFLVFSDSEPASEPAGINDSLETETEIEDPPTPRERGEECQQAVTPSDNGEVQNPAETIDEALAGTTPCLVCGTPVRTGYRCPNCNAAPRTAGSSSRQVASRPKTTAYQRAETLTRNGAWQYDLGSYREELTRFELTADERQQLEALREELIDYHDAYSW
jgi:hypothetical protein